MRISGPISLETEYKIMHNREFWCYEIEVRRTLETHSVDVPNR